MRMGYVTYFFVFFLSVGCSFGSVCPENSTILQKHGHRIWCVWIVDRMLNESSLAEECQRLDGNIYIVEDETVQQYLNDTLGPILTKRFFNETTTIWIHEDVKNDLTQFLSYSNWDMFFDGQGNCITASQPMFLWRKSWCDEQHYGICYKELNCPSNGTYVLEGDLCYWIPFEMPLVMRKAEFLCNKNNGTLAVIPGQNVLDALSTNELLLNVENLWLGLNDRDEEGVFKTKDNDPAPFLKWDIGNPDDFLYPDVIEDCMILQPYNSKFSMNDVSCRMEAVPLCFNATHSMETIPSPTTSVQLSTAASKLIEHQQVSNEAVLIDIKLDIPETTTHAESDLPCPSTDKQETCSCVKKEYNMEYLNGSDALTKQLEKMKSENHVDFKNTSAYLRSLVCATDDRPSSQCMGIAAAAILVTMLSLIVLLDTVTLLRVMANSHK